MSPVNRSFFHSLNRILVSLLYAGTLVNTLEAFATAAETKPRFILQVTVDQSRGDLPDKFLANMPEGGFRYLRKHGLWYANAHYGHANTETVVGHTTLATGADPSEHGMVANVWFNRDTDKLAYNVEDNR